MLKKILKVVLVGLLVAVLGIAILGLFLPRAAGGESLGGSIYNRFISFDAGIGVKGVEFLDKDGNLEISGTTTLGDAGSDTVTVTGKVTGDIYWNDTASADKTIKAHNHDSTSTMNAEFKYDSDISSGATYGVWSDNNIGTTGTASATAVLGVATVETGVTVTDSTLIGTYGQAHANGTVAGNSFMTGLYGLIEASAAITAKHVTSLWLDSHQANAVTGSHQLLYMTNNGTATMDEAIFIYGGNHITNLLKLDTVSGMVEGPSTAASGTPVKIQIDVDGTSYYINAYPTSNN